VIPIGEECDALSDGFTSFCQRDRMSRLYSPGLDAWTTKNAAADHRHTTGVIQSNTELQIQHVLPAGRHALT